MATKEVILRQDEDFITLNNILKMFGIISTGGQAKIFLINNEVLVNKEVENRRGRKLFRGDVIKLDGFEILIK